VTQRVLQRFGTAVGSAEREAPCGCPPEQRRATRRRPHDIIYGSWSFQSG